MNPFHNLPPAQRRTQRLVEQFNADERLWQKLEPRRRLRRLARPKLSKQQHRVLDLREFARQRPPADAIGQWVMP
jgi:hypothetical protein